MLYLQLTLCTLLFLAMMVVIVIVLMWEWSLVATRAPFIPIPKEVIPLIFEALELRSGSTLYDLGCGEGRVLLDCWQRLPEVKYIGIEKSRLAYWLACINRRKQKAHQVQFKKKNFFKVDLSDATHVFTYLFPGLMDLLLPKLEKELKPGTRLVSCDFKFKNKEPIRVIELKRSEKELGQKLYIYEF